VSPPTEERRFFAKLLQHIAIIMPLEKYKPKNQSIASVFSVFFCLKRVQKSMTVQPLGSLGIILSQWRSQ
jgi:hypothetical protein